MSWCVARAYSSNHFRHTLESLHPETSNAFSDEPPVQFADKIVNIPFDLRSVVSNMCVEFDVLETVSKPVYLHWFCVH